MGSAGVNNSKTIFINTSSDRSSFTAADMITNNENKLCAVNDRRVALAKMMLLCVWVLFLKHSNFVSN